MKEKGLDQALQDYGKAGQMTRDLLLSTNMYDFFSGTAGKVVKGMVFYAIISPEKLN